MRIVLPACAIIAAIAIICAPATAEPVKIRAGWIQPVSNIVSILFLKKGIARHYGQTYIVEPLRFAGTAPMVTGMAIDEVDVGVLGAAALGLGVLNAGMDDLRIVADEFQDGVPGYYSNEFMARDDGSIRTIEDVKGKIVATNSAGGALDVAMRAVLRQHGLEDKRDYTSIEVPASSKKAILLEKKADLISLPLPFSYDAELRAHGRVLFTQRDVMGVSSMGFWSARAGFIARHRAAFVDFLEDALLLTRWYQNSANHDEATMIAASYAKTQPSFFSDWIFTRKDYYRDPDLQPNIEALQNNIDLTAQTGFLPRAFDVRPLVDLSFLEEARKRLN